MVTMNVLLIGCGGRESAIASSLTKTNSIKLYAIMSYHNPDIINKCEDFLIASEKDINTIVNFSKKKDINFVFVGSEIPLYFGVVDQLLKENINCIGPLKCCSQLETNKAWTRKFIDKYNLGCNPKYNIFDLENETSLKKAFEYIDLINSVVIKPIGLTGGKGVKVIGEQLNSIEEAKQYVTKLFTEKIYIIIEDKLVGEEFTLQAFVDGDHLLFCPLVQDHKRLLDGDKGENTGGMGSYTDIDHSLPFITIDIIDKAKQIMNKTIHYLFIETGFKYKGILYGQFIFTNKHEIKLIEYNVRFGDPESINVLYLLKTNLLDICISIINGSLNKINICFEKKATVCKYLVPKGYPLNSLTDQEIIISDNLNYQDIYIYYANVELLNQKIYTTCSRSIAILGVGKSIYKAEKKISEYIIKNLKTNLYYRKDIGTKESISKKIKILNKN